MRLNTITLRFLIGLSILLIASSIFIISLLVLKGLRFPYLVFSLISFAGLVLGLCQKKSYTYLYLSVFIWLGFWLKFSVHSIIGYQFIEPIGLFHGSAKNWEEVLNISSVGYCGVIVAGLLMLSFFKRSTSISVNTISPPAWYLSVRKKLWVILLLATLVTAITNFSLSIHQIGLVPNTILIWPMNAIISWLINIGLITAILTLLWWDINLNISIGASIYAIIFEGFSSSISVMSRAIYIFHVVPSLLPLALNNNLKPRLWSRKKALLLIFGILFFFTLSISAVTTLRNYYYQADSYSSTKLEVISTSLKDINNKILRSRTSIVSGDIEALEVLAKLEETKLKTIEELNQELQKLESVKNSKTLILVNEFQYQIQGGMLQRILFLSVDRWVGLEGVMAVQAYPDKNIDTLLDSIESKRGGSQADIFQKISQSIYEKMAYEKYNFRSLPGFIAYLYFSGSFAVVFLGSIVLISLVMFLELGILALTGNRLLVSLYSAELANNVAQFGGEPRQTLHYLFILACGIGVVWFVSSRYFLDSLKAIGIYKPPTNGANGC